VAILDGPASLLRVMASNDSARKAGIEIGMTKLQAEACGRAVLLKVHGRPGRVSLGFARAG